MNPLGRLRVDRPDRDRGGAHRRPGVRRAQVRRRPRATRSINLRENTTETAFVTAALHEALTKVKAQEREMSARAEASERLSGEIVESLSSGLLVVASDGQLRILNPAGRRLLNRDDAAHRAAVPRRAAARRSRRSSRSASTGGTPIVRRTVADRLGRPVAGVFRRQRVAALDGRQPHGAICLFTDLTPVVEMEEQLRLKESLAQVGELTAGIAHEFRNGLATIHGYARLLDLNALPASYHPHLQGIRQETEALGEVVTNFLNFAKPAAADAFADRSSRDRRACRRRSAERGAGAWRRCDRAAAISRSSKATTCCCGRRSATSFRNAVEACVDASRAPQVVIDGRLEPATCGWRSTTTARASPPTDRERIFRPFVTTKGRGTGLGLALVQKIIVTHNGRIQVAAAAGGGASFQIVLPSHGGLTTCAIAVDRTVILCANLTPCP